ncbi:MAG: dATP/dGTP diphosphohydrolase domain-containing protein [Bacteroidota bacterium]|jgi:hypothetical protein
MSLEDQSAAKDKDSKVSLTEIDPAYIVSMGRRMSENKNKYGKFNWKKSIDVLDLVDALERHLLDIKSILISGSPVLNIDESLNDHLASIGCNAMMINYQINNYERVAGKS